MNGTVFQSMIEQALLQIHTGFFGKVITAGDGMATVQSLSMIKEVGGQAVPQAVVENCPVLSSAVKFLSTNNPVQVRRVQTGDIVYCVCADRDISATKNGVMAVPVPGHHMLSSAVVVGIL